jgi:hypothetical protein
MHATLVSVFRNFKSNIVGKTCKTSSCLLHHLYRPFGTETQSVRLFINETFAGKGFGHLCQCHYGLYTVKSIDSDV